MKTGKEMTAVKLRNGLITVVILLFAASSAGFYFAFQWIAKEAQSVGNTVAEASASSNLSGSLVALQTTLAQQQEIARLANGLYATSTGWQTQVIKDVNAYAAASGIEVSDFKLSADPTTSPATLPGTTPANSGTTSPTKNFTITLKAPVSYTGILTFMSYVSNNIPKMHINGAEMSRAAEGNNSVNITTLEIGVYVR